MKEQKLNIKFIEGEFQRVTINKNDIIIISYPGILSKQSTDNLKEQAQRIFPDNNILVLDNNMKIGAMSLD
jgi:hypothetical protein